MNLHLCIHVALSTEKRCIRCAKVPQEKLEAYIYPSLSGKRKPLVKQRDAKDKVGSATRI